MEDLAWLHHQQQLDQQEQEQLEMRTEHDVLKELWLLRKGDRPARLLEIIQTEPLDDKVIDQLILHTWEECEFPSSIKLTWDELWQNYSWTDQHQERLIRRLFKQPRTVYRGGPKTGRSWTLKKECAEWFENYRSEFRKFYDNNDYEEEMGVWSKTVSAQDVQAVLFGRGEYEVVLVD